MSSRGANQKQSTNAIVMFSSAVHYIGKQDALELHVCMFSMMIFIISFWAIAISYPNNDGVVVVTLVILLLETAQSEAWYLYTY